MALHCINYRGETLNIGGPVKIYRVPRGQVLGKIVGKSLHLLFSVEFSKKNNSFLFYFKSKNTHFVCIPKV